MKIEDVLVLPQKITTTWNNKTKKYYESKGYIYTKNWDSFEINILDLPENSNMAVQCKCTNCEDIVIRGFNTIKVALKRKNLLCVNCRFKSSIEFYTLYMREIKKTVILPQHIKMKWNGLSSEWYINKGYKYTKQNDEFYVNVLDLPIVSDAKVKCNCEYCGITFESNFNRITGFILNNEKQSCKSCCQKIIKVEKIEKTNLEKYGAKYIFQAPDYKDTIIEKSIKARYKNGTFPSSKQQRHLHQLLSGELNYPMSSFALDIAFPEEKLYVEYDGSGHDLRTRMGVSREEFERKEFKRKAFMQNRGWKIIRIISQRDYLPQDDEIIKLVEECKDYLNSNHSWINIDIDNMKLICSQFERDLNLNLRKLQKDI